MENSKVVRYGASKSAGLNTRARFYLREVVSSQLRVMKGSFKEWIHRENGGTLPLKYRHVSACTLSLNDQGLVHLQDAVLMFACFGGADYSTSLFADDDFITACLGDEEDECEGDLERKELKEAVRVVLSTPAVFSTP